MNVPGFRVFGMRGRGLAWVIENNPTHQTTVRCLADFERGCAAWFCSCWFPTWD